MYRSSYAGFIFQDYHLLEELTVEENVSLFLDANTNVTKPMVEEKLKLVGLDRKCSIFHTIHSEPSCDLPKIYRLFLKKSIIKNKIWFLAV